MKYHKLRGSDVKRLIAYILILAALVLWAVPTAAAGSLEITGETDGNGEVARLFDGNDRTSVTLRHGETIRVQTSATDAVQYVHLLFRAEDCKYVLQAFDTNGDCLYDVEHVSAFEQVLALPNGTASVKLIAKSTLSVLELAVYAEEFPSHLVSLVEPPERTDLLVVACTFDEVTELYGSLLAQYRLGYDAHVTVVILRTPFRYELDETVQALRTMGIDIFPYMMGFSDDENSTSRIKKQWGKSVTEHLTEMLLQTRPTVIVTNGKKDDRSAYALEHLFEAIEASATADDPHTVQKVYAVDASGQTVLSYETPLASADGQTAYEVATAAHNGMESRAVFGSELPKSQSFSVLSSKVGTDATGSDLFEQIPLAQRVRCRETLAVCTPEPTEPPTPEPTTEPTLTPTEQPEDPSKTGTSNFEEEESTGIATHITVSVCILGTGIVICLLLFLALRKRFKSAMLWSALCAAAFLCAAIMTFFLLRVEEAKQTEETVTATAELTPTQTSTPTPTAAESPKEDLGESEQTAPTPTPHPFAEHFLPDDAAEREYIEMDEDNGIWIYRNPTLAVEITRTLTTIERNGEELPLAYYTAHIYMREYDSFRPSFASERQNGRTVEYPETFLCREKPVLWITGDNMIHADTDLKGHIIRNGRLYHNSSDVASLAIDSETLSLRIVDVGVTANEVLDSGILNTYSFGPVLIRDGVPNENVRTDGKQSGIARENPRTGIGMVEPGHLVAIVVDGRQPEYSVGVTFEEFIPLFQKEGCVLAYNLDGGVSACMCFLGKRVNHHAENDIRVGINASWQRKIPDGLMWGYSAAVPDDLSD